MDSQFSLGSADNKGILSLLSAIEQTGDNFDTDPDSDTSDLKTEDTSQFSQFSGLDISFSPALSKCELSACLVCGETCAEETMDMIHISTELEAGRRLGTMIEDIVARKINTALQSSLACSQCFSLLQQIHQLETELQLYKRKLTTKYCVANPVTVKPGRNYKKGKGSLNTEQGSGSVSLPLPPSLPSASLGEPGDFSDPVIDAKMPLQFLANEREPDLERKSSLDILAQEAELEGDHLTYSSSDEEKEDGSCLECDLCNKVMKTPSQYQRHMKSHIKDKVYACEECDKTFSTKHNMVGHMKTHIETKTFRCPHCDREFKGKKSLIEHISSKHNNEKRYVCSQCPETFISRHLKNVHERTHNGERGFICDQCGESFATVQGLGHHRSKHTGDYQYRCRTCNKGFNNYKLMEEHFHIHTGDKPYQCSHCDKGFANRGSLWIHQRQHQDSKPYACPDCNKGFSHSSHLAVHRRIHTGEKPYRCRLCVEGFISSNHLKRHMKSHAGALPFACGTCKATFNQRRQLVTHSNKMHGGQVVEEALAAAPGEGEGEGQYQEEQYSLMPVSLMDEGLGEVQGLEEGQGRLVDLLGQTVVLIQVPGSSGSGGKDGERDKPAVQF